MKRDRSINLRAVHFKCYILSVCCVLVPAKFMRFPRVKADGQGYYHCVSRVVSPAIGSNRMEQLGSSACLIAIADVCMTSRSLSKNSKADLPSGTTSVMTATGYSGPSDSRVSYWKGERHWPPWLLTSSSTRSEPVCVLTPRITVTAVTPRLLPRVLFLPVKGSEPFWASRRRSSGRNLGASIANTSLSKAVPGAQTNRRRLTWLLLNVSLKSRMGKFLCPNACFVGFGTSPME